MIDKLYGYCREQETAYLKDKELLGVSHPFVVERLHELMGMEKAFKFLAGCSVTDYMISLLKRE